MTSRLVILAVVALGVLLIVDRAGSREIRRIAAQLIPCPAEQIDVVASDASDTAEVHRVRGCGIDATLICSAPDFDCVIATTTPVTAESTLR